MRSEFISVVALLLYMYELVVTLSCKNICVSEAGVVSENKGSSEFELRPSNFPAAQLSIAYKINKISKTI